VWENIDAYATPSQCVAAPEGPFLGVKVEQHERYDIFWFIWDKDGIVPKRFIPQDWEPVILYWKSDKLARVTVRYHYEWTDYSAPDFEQPHFSLPLRVIFTGSNHGAIVRKENDPLFDFSLQSHRKLEFDFKATREEDVPSFARKGFLNRRGALIAAGQDIHDRAQETLSEISEF
jgi:hypothetical protein